MPDSSRRDIDRFEPCLLAVQRDPQTIGRLKFDLVAHLWNELSDHDRTDLSGDLFVVPFRTVELMGDITSDFYAPSRPVWCPECFGEGGPEVTDS